MKSDNKPKLRFFAYDELLVGFNTIPDKAAFESLIAPFNASTIKHWDGFNLCHIAVNDMNQYQALIAAIDSHENVSFSELNEYCTKRSENFSSTAPKYEPFQQPFLGLMNVEEAWAITKGAANVKIALCDTGTCIAHPNLQGANIVAPLVAPNVDSNGNLLAITVNDVTRTFATDDTDAHGTFISGILVGQHNGTGVAGIAPNCALEMYCMTESVIVSGSGNDTTLNAQLGTIDTIISCLQSASLRGCKVFSLSIGAETIPSSLESAFTTALNTYGMLTCYAAGNNSEIINYTSSSLMIAASTLDGSRAGGWSAAGPDIFMTTCSGGTADGYGYHTQGDLTDFIVSTNPFDLSYPSGSENDVLNLGLAFNGTITSGYNNITNLHPLWLTPDLINTTTLMGMPVSGIGIPAGSCITGITSFYSPGTTINGFAVGGYPSAVTISNNATASNGGLTLGIPDESDGVIAASVNTVFESGSISHHTHFFTSAATVTIETLNGGGGGEDYEGQNGGDTTLSINGVQIAYAQGGGGTFDTGNNGANGTASVTSAITGATTGGAGNGANQDSEAAGYGGDGGQINGGTFHVNQGDVMILSVGAGGVTPGATAYHATTVDGGDGSATLSWTSAGATTASPLDNNTAAANFFISLTTGYVAGSGTSFSTPQCAATIALLYSINPNFTPTQIKSFLTSTALPLPNFKDQNNINQGYGAGLLNIGGAITDALAANGGMISVSAGTMTASSQRIGPLLPGQTRVRIGKLPAGATGVRIR